MELTEEIFLKLRVVLLFFILYPCLIVGQSRDIRNTISMISSSEQYVYVQVSNRDKELAEKEARSQIEFAINQRYRNADNVLSTIGQINHTSRFLELRGVEKLTWRSGREEFVFWYLSLEDARWNYVLNRMHQFRLNPEIHWGESFHENSESARQAARIAMLSGIQVTIMAQQDMTIVDDGMKSSSEFVSRVNAISNLTLLGLRQLQALRLDDVFYSFVYISKEDLERSMEVTETRVLSFIREAEINERNGQISRALQNYYKAYLYCISYYRNMAGTLDNQEVVDMRVALQNKIKNIIDKSVVRSRPAYEASQGNILASFDIINDGYRFSNLIYRFDFESTSVVDKVVYGEGRISFRNFLPSRMQEVFRIGFFIDLGDDLLTDPYLNSMEPISRIVTYKELPIGFHNLIQINIDISKNNNQYQLDLVPRNLMIQSILWEFDDYTRFNGNRVVRQMNENDIYAIKITINGDDNLVFNRWIDPSVKEVYLANPKITNEPVAGLVTPPVVLPTPAVTLPDSKDTDVIKPAEIMSRYDLISQKYSDLFRIRNTARLFNVLQQYASDEALRFGHAYEFDDKEGLVAIIFDNNNIYDYLYFEKNVYQSLISSIQMNELTSRFQNMRIAWIYFEVKQ